MRIVFANEQVRPGEPAANPDVTESVDAGLYQVLGLDALVRIKLTAYRDKDRTHLRDRIELGLLVRLGSKSFARRWLSASNCFWTRPVVDCIVLASNLFV